MFLRTLITSLILLFLQQFSAEAQIRTTYEKSFNIQGGLTYNTSPEYNKFWNYGYTFAISREKEFNSGWYVLGGARYSRITFSDDDFLISTGLGADPNTELDFDDSQIMQAWGAIKYAYPLIFSRLRIHGMGGIHVSYYDAGSVTVANQVGFDIKEEDNLYAGLLFGGGLSFELIPEKLRIFAETQYHIGSTAGTDTIFIGIWPVEFGISF